MNKKKEKNDLGYMVSQFVYIETRVKSEWHRLQDRLDLQQAITLTTILRPEIRRRKGIVKSCESFHIITV